MVNKKNTPTKLKTGSAPLKTGSAPRAAAPRKTTKHVDFLLGKTPLAMADFFDDAPVDKLLAVLDQSYASDLVNVLLDVKKSTVKNLLGRLYKTRKRRVMDVSTLYYYKDYLTNPLPLELETEGGIKMPNFYAILGVPRDAKYEDLKEAHRLLARAHGPEIFSPSMRKASDERRQEINNAYNQLKNPQKREKADRLLPNMGYFYPRRDQSWLEAVRRISM